MRLVLKIILAILLLSIVIGLSVAVCGCQSPSAVYTNGLIVWCSTSAVGIGWGEYAEVAAGGKLDRVSTNRCDNIVGDGDTGAASRLRIDNSLIIVPTNHTEQADGADLP
jgi:hypothetical protein